ncbi:Ribosomal RNA small subunit methyltransferase E [Halomicronema hongdechloris C2206]|uniref:Ribosomal RNA small subunit methyltransferase E n=1 Tax=Halomicronema hongdechloris C2206 TaxID=1641165 RepID=A0A1Z3HKN4_9CYAN|nr:16S rRNA (uracil(1498)-N(3))-methyltransferase [Halomicronema hongdechloris]ASC70858.1 Ribosomal RNA small subunit methyltransferase E [Halomicronema hongdechloris C2206]
MTLQRLVVDPIQMQADQLHLTAEQQRYLHRVLRYRPGDRFMALDGHGHQWLAELTPDLALAVVVSPGASVVPAPQVDITLMAALPKGNSFDQVVRQATELGVSCIQPVISDRTLLHPSPKRLDRWRRIAAEAMEQSEQPRVPPILAPCPWSSLLIPSPEARYLCVARQDAPSLLACLLQQSYRRITIAIGPEGGWSPSEVEAALVAGFQPVSLGNTVLRAVTAPVVALAVAHAAANLQAVDH